MVRKQGEFYELIDGERRWKVLKELGWETVPVRVVDADDSIARLSVYKLNKIRKNYKVEEEARYFKKLTDEGMTPLGISKQLNVDSRWVLHASTYSSFLKKFRRRCGPNRLASRI